MARTCPVCDEEYDTGYRLNESKSIDTDDATKVCHHIKQTHDGRLFNPPDDAITTSHVLYLHQ